MNGNLTNIISYMKEVSSLKNKNIYDFKEFILSLDFNSFINKYQDLLTCYNNPNILTEGVILTLKYIGEKDRYEMPVIPELLKEYIKIDKESIVNLKDNLQDELKLNNLVEIYNEYIFKVNDVKKLNKRFDDYNNVYLKIYNYYKRITDYEEKLEIVLATYLLCYKATNSIILKRHILESNLKLEVDSVNNTISFVTNNIERRGFLTDFLNINNYKIKDIVALHNTIDEFNEQSVLNEDIVISDYTKRYLSNISYENEVINESINSVNIDSLDTNKMYLFNNKHIIIRNKNTKLWNKEFDDILEICKKEKINSNIINLLDVDFNDKEKLDELLVDKEEETKNILFPLETNAEQYKIVKRINDSNVALVQGPPGTGKSHTITNLIAHYIAEGKKIIVTSEKSKALEVIKEKLPEAIKPLCLSILSTKVSDKELENSIDNILKRGEKIEELDIIENNIYNLDRALNTVKQEKLAVEADIVNLMYLDGISHRDKLSKIVTENTYNTNLIDIALWLKNNEKYNIIPLNDNENNEYDLKKISNIFKEVNTITDEVAKYNYDISIPIEKKDYLVNESIDHLMLLINKNTNYIIQNKGMQNAVIFEKINADIIDELTGKINDFYNICDLFGKKYIFDMINYTVSMDSVKDILKDLETDKNKLYDTEKNKLYYSIQYDKNKINDYVNAVNCIITNIKNKEGLTLVDKIKFGNELRLLKEIKFNSIDKSTDILKHEVLNILSLKLNMDKSALSIKHKLKSVFKQDVFDLLDIKESDFSKKYTRVEKILSYIINIKTKINDINDILDKVVNREIFNFDFSKEEYNKTLSVINDLKYFDLNNIYLSDINRKIDIIHKDYDGFKLIFLNEYIHSIRSLDENGYKEAKIKLNKEIDTINFYQTIRYENKKFFDEKECFMLKYMYDLDEEKRKFVNNEFLNILNYHFVHKLYISKEEKVSLLKELFSKKQKLEKEEKDKILKLIETKGWYNQIKSMTPVITASLGKWLSHKRKYGKGTGKYSSLYLQNMQREMQIARNAIPVWIMPVEKLIEQYPFNNEPQFDVIIMDESSQTSVLSITALARGRKVIIVGDDKQISPINVGQAEDVINNLRIKYLKSNPWSYLLERNTSIYDIVQTVCNSKKIFLTEHFRCLPEIINFSKYEYYNKMIVPLKIRGIENTIPTPIKTIYVENGKCSKNGNHLYNSYELEKLISFLKQIEEDKNYDNKTLGIICLQNSPTQIKMLLDLLIKNFGEDFLIKRKVKAGTSSEFQGDERDVIVLFMIVSSKLDTGEEYKFASLSSQENDRSFNVAMSRAKEQVVLIHSVKLEELNSNCNRYKLLNYCLNYDKKDDVEIEKLFKNKFEKDVYNSLNSDKIKLIPKYTIGEFTLDFIIENDNGYKIAIMCDGDEYLAREDYEKDLEMQTTLERCSWKVIRIRASKFYYNQDSYINSIITSIKEYLYEEN